MSGHAHCAYSPPDFPTGCEATFPMDTLRDGSQVTIRPICKGDIELERQFIERLSPEARRYRFLYTIATPSEALLQRLTDIDTRNEAALIAVVDEGVHEREVGVARFSSTPDGTAEVAVTVDGDWQGRGLATLLMQRLITVARERGITALFSMDPAGNERMRELAASLGFTRKPDPQDATQVIYTLALQPQHG
jgi:GNAT superfamily N-acetyltransferase